MTEKEKALLYKLSKIISVLNDTEKKYLLGVADGMLIAKNLSKEVKK